MVDAALAAPVPDVSALAGRDVYADAVDELTARIGWKNLAGIPSPSAVLWAAADADVVRCYRLAAGIMLDAVINGDHVRRDREWLRSLDTESARLCLAMLGECSWQDASPRERAGYLLGSVVEARRVLA
jgi:hypothetical protein